LDLVTMSGRELQRIEVLSEVLARRRTEISAATILGLSTRQTRRLLTAYRDGGGGALIHKARGRTSNNRLIPGIREYVIELVRSRYPKFVTNEIRDRLSGSESVQATAESALHSRWKRRCSGRLIPSCRSKDFCSVVGSVTRRSLISRPSVVGRTMSALWRVDSRAIALIGVMGWALSTPLTDGFGSTGGRRFSRCFRVTHKA
jgi:hypothetical protein